MPFQLALLLLAQPGHYLTGRRDPPGPFVLQLFQHIGFPAGGYFDVLKLLVDGDTSRLKIHAVPSEPQQLSLPHTGEHIDQERQFVGVSPDRLYEAFQSVIVQRRQLPAGILGQNALIRRVCPQIVDTNSLLQGTVKHQIDHPDRAGGKPRIQPAVAEPLDRVRGQPVQLDVSQLRLQMVADDGTVAGPCPVAQVPAVVLQPDVQPLGKGQLTGFVIGPLVNLRGDLAQLLRYLFLCFAGDRVLDLLPGLGIIPGGVSGFPVEIFFAVSFYDFLSDRAAARGAPSVLFPARHSNPPFAAQLRSDT